MHLPLNSSGCLILKKVLRLKGKSAHTAQWGNQTDKINTYQGRINQSSEFFVEEDNFETCGYHNTRESWKQFNWALMILVTADRAQAENGILEKVQELAVLWT